MTDRKHLRALDLTAEPALTVADVQERGNEIVTEITQLVLKALDRSNGIGSAGAFKRPVTPTTLRRIRSQASRAAEAWQKVDAACAEVLDLERRMKS